MRAKSGVGGKFEDDIASLFRLAGYSIEQNVDYGGQEFDIIATKDEIGKLKSRIAIECKFRKAGTVGNQDVFRSEEHTSELQSLMRTSYAVFCLKKKNKHNTR